MNPLTRQLIFVAAMALCPSVALAEGDVAAGKAVFKKCAACHFVNKEKKKLGPHLIGLVGRKAGVVDKYKH